ncbi:hypothetical protein HR45_18405 [Shewanella mangrovi]|uniref:Chemotaxis protein n=1 Tax=Shewanella mangrovi TaxID=1515746 RepID=A0A094J9X0_9GAMM|nr:methyl-accepting chemotaxis protein [Shewanella mangrovi]KFZ36052.1 hypothetical protein HR45_18405 [Shewanella mangrovi]
MAARRLLPSFIGRLFARFIIRLSISQKVILGFSLLALLIIGGCIANLLSSERVEQQLNLMTDSATPLVLQTNQLGKVLLNADRQLKTVPGIEDSHLAITTIDNFGELKNAFAEALAELKRLAGSNEELQSLISPLDSLDEDYFAQGKSLGEQQLAKLKAEEQLTDLRQQWSSLAGEISRSGVDISAVQDSVMSLMGATDDFAVSRAGQNIEQQKTALTQPLSSDAQQLLNQLVASKTAAVTANQQLHELIDFTGGTIDYAIAVLGAVDQAAHTSVTDSAAKVRAALQTGLWLSLIALAISLPLVILVTANIYLSIKRPLKELLRVQHAAVDGNLSQDVNYSSHNEFGLLANSTNALLSHIRHMLQQFTDGASQLTNVAEQTRSRSQQTHQALDAQRQQTMQVNVAMEQLGKAVEEVAQAASLSLDSVIAMGNAVTKGREQVNVSIKGSETLASHLKDASESLKAVDSSSSEIGGVLDVIKGVAEQTNLLALNAAIEAARAGEHGRGFAVVASEVRTLAQQTGESANTIKQIIDHLQQRAHATVNLMDNCQMAMAEGLQQSADTASCMNDIQQLIADVSRNSEQIASAAVEQQSSCEHIASNIRQIADFTEDSYAGVSAFAESSEHLEQLVLAQEQLVTKFQA